MSKSPRDKSDWCKSSWNLLNWCESFCCLSDTWQASWYLLMQVILLSDTWQASFYLLFQVILLSLWLVTSFLVFAWLMQIILVHTSLVIINMVFTWLVWKLFWLVTITRYLSRKNHLGIYLLCKQKLNLTYCENHIRAYLDIWNRSALFGDQFLLCDPCFGYGPCACRRGEVWGGICTRSKRRLQSGREPQHWLSKTPQQECL